MPTAPKRVCPACRCTKPCSCEGQRSPQAKAWHRLYDAKWTIYAKHYLIEHYECVDPMGVHVEPVSSECVDHIIPHRGNLDLFLDRSNHRALCRSCNNTLAAREQGAFGNARRV